MKILAVDTATKTCSICIADNEDLLAEISVNHGQTHSRRLMPMIDMLLGSCGFTPRGMDGIAVTIGPGSFTGLRIGLSTVKAVAFAASLPVAGVSTLEALAFQFPFASCPVCPMIDARKGEVYSALYSFTSGGLRQLRPAGAGPPEEALKGISGQCLFAGSGALLYRKLICSIAGGNALFVPEGENHIRALSIAVLGRRKLESGFSEPASKLRPWYIRPSDAEKKLHQGPGRNSNSN